MKRGVSFGSSASASVVEVPCTHHQTSVLGLVSFSSLLLQTHQAPKTGRGEMNKGGTSDVAALVGVGRDNATMLPARQNKTALLYSCTVWLISSISTSLYALGTALRRKTSYKVLDSDWKYTRKKNCFDQGFGTGDVP